MAVTLDDIAKKAGVSVSTVSRVFNSQAAKYRISPGTARRIRQVAREFDYRPNQLARGLRLRRTHTLGLVVPDISNPFFAYVIRGIQQSSHRLGYSLVVCDTDENLDLEVEHINVLRSKSLDGLIVMPVGQRYEHLQKLLRDNIPLVLLDRSFPDFPATSVVIDNHKGAYDGVEHLIGFGHRRIALIQGLPHTYTNTGRVAGYKDALSRHGIPIDPNLIVGKDFRRENGYRETKALLRRDDRPTAIFATSDLITLGALQAIAEAGLRIPQDISLVAFDDIDFAMSLMCPVTAVAQPKEEMGETAVRLLMESIRNHGKMNAERVTLEPKLVVRNSVGPVSQLAGASHA